MEDEPFDSLGGNGTPPPASTELRKSTPSVPPSFAFNRGGTSTPGAPPPSSFNHSMSGPDPITPYGEPSTHPVPPAPASDLPDRWKQYETEMENHRSESSFSHSRSVAPPAERETTRRYAQEEQGMTTSRTGGVAVSTPSKQQPYTNYSLYETPPAARHISAQSEFAPRQDHTFTKSKSYDTDELIRKYGGLTGIPPTISSRLTSPSVLGPPPEEVRHQALKVLDLVDNRLGTPVDIRRTESGGFRSAPSMAADSSPYEVRRTDSSGAIMVQDGSRDAYDVQRTYSGSLHSGPNSNTGGRRVPAALSGLNFSSRDRSSWNAARCSFSDPSFRDDDHMSDEEDEIIRSVPLDDGPVVDVVRLQNRAAASRPISNAEKFDGDFPGTPQASAWSSRYSDTHTSQKRILDQWDREFETERSSAANMFMSNTASNMKSAASNAWTAAEIQKAKVFGSGFSFRSNHVFGHHNPGVEKPEVNLRTVWKEVDGENDIEGTSAHKTWQEVMLNKRKRRRVLGIGGLLLLAIITVLATTSKIVAKNNAIKATGSGIGAPVTFYLTSDAPYDQAEEEKMTKDLQNVPSDAEFIMHLGNIQEAAVTMCPSSRYNDVASILKKSPVPLFILPGEEDWSKCPSPDKSLDHWLDAFVKFDSNFNHPFKVFRDQDNPEAFSMLHNGVLFLGLHIVSGPVNDEAAWQKRETEMLTFYFGMTNLNKGKFRAIVLLGNARPSPQQSSFFTAVFSSLKDIRKPMAYIHANTEGDAVLQYKPFPEQQSIFGIGVQNGGKTPPLKLTVGFGDRPFLIG